jgi:hypothetical protein
MKDRLKPIYFYRQKSGFLSILGLLITLVIISVLVYYLLNTYFKTAGIPVQQKSGPGSSAGINTSSYQSIISSSRNAVDNINKRSQSQLDELMGIK